MKTVMKKIFSLLLVAVLLVSAVPTALAAEGTVTCPNGHEAEFVSNHTAATCTANQVVVYKCKTEDCHWVGGFYVEVENTAGHKPGAAATCTAAQTCTVCGAELAAKLSHTPGAAATCSAPQTCTVCGGTLAEINPTAHNPGPAATCNVPQTCTLCNGVLAEKDPTAHVAGAAATCVAPQTCTVCGGTLADIAPNAHKPGPEATCTAAQTCTLCGVELAAKKEHTIVDGHCTTCSAGGNDQATQKPARKAINWQVKNVEGGSVVKSGSFTPNGESAVAKDILYYHVFNRSNTWKDQYNVTKVWSSKQQKNVGYDGAIAEGDTVTFLLIPKEGNSGSGNSGSGNSGSQTPSGDSYLVVNVNLYTSDVLTQTLQLVRYDGISKDAKVYDVISSFKSDIISRLPSGYTWGGNVYDNDNDREAELMNATIGNGRTVYINAYSDQDLVYIYVHNSRSMNNLRIVQLHGKKLGETVTKAEVYKAVSKYFHLDSLYMFDEQSWEDYVDGKSVQDVDSLKVTSEPFFIDVRISGSANSSSSGSGYTADSSNPKTGDTIFAPVAVLGLSATALAVLLFLNKKRAY